MDSSVKLQVKDGRVQPLYKHIIHVELPTLNFIGIAVVGCRVFHLQAHYACAIARGLVTLPSRSEMYRSEEEDYQTRVVAKGLPPKRAHYLVGPGLPDYTKSLRVGTDYNPIPPAVFKLLKRLFEVIGNEYGTYKQRTFRLVGDEEYEEFA